jgi:hypothetical protein
LIVVQTDAGRVVAHLLDPAVLVALITVPVTAILAAGPTSLVADAAETDPTGGRCGRRGKAPRPVELAVALPAERVRRAVHGAALWTDAQAWIGRGALSCGGCLHERSFVR